MLAPKEDSDKMCRFLLPVPAPGDICDVGAGRE